MTHRGPFQPLPFCDSTACSTGKREGTEQAQDVATPSELANSLLGTARAGK